MFKVKSIRSGVIRTVYNVDGLQFLFFRDGKWSWDYCRYYVPLEESDG